MPTPFKPVRTTPLPKDAQVVERDGKPHVRVRDHRGRLIWCPLTKDGKAYLRPSNCWYFDLKDESGRVRRVKGSPDKNVTEQMIAEAVRRVERRRLGYADPLEDYLTRPLREHLGDFAAHLEAKGDTARHVRETIARVVAVLDGCGFVLPADLDASKLEAWLSGLRKGTSAVRLPVGEAFASSVVAELLGIKVDSVRRFVARHRLPTVGTGRDRRLTRQAVEFIARKQAEGLAPRSVNALVIAIRSFTSWLVRGKRLASDPFESLSLLNAAVDVRLRRRELTADEIRRLLDAAQRSPRVFRGLTGPDRRLLYLTAVTTAFRAGALAHLRPCDFDLARGVVTLPVVRDKARRGMVQPLTGELLEAMRGYLEGKPAQTPIWPGTWHTGCMASAMIRAELEEAGIPHTVSGPDGDERVDFHGLRHTALTLAGKVGNDLSTVQKLAGHSSPTVTARYVHRRSEDLRAAVDRLPSFGASGAGKVPAEEALNGAVEGAVPGAVNRCIRSQEAAPIRTLEHVDGSSESSSQTHDATPLDASSHRVAPGCSVAGVLGFEPRQTDPESVVLPLHHTPSSSPC